MRKIWSMGVFGLVALSALVSSATFADPVTIEGPMSTRLQAQALSDPWDDFMCRCQAAGPGFEIAANAVTLCSYQCSCDTMKDGEVSKTVQLSLKHLPTSAISFDEDDRAAKVCHGQYTYHSNLNSPSRDTEVRFSAFSITDLGNPYFEDSSVEIAPNVSIELKRSEAAPEIRTAIRAKLLAQ